MIKSKLNKIDLVILAGGRGSRISKLTKKTPKPLIKFNNRHFISYLINYYSKYPFQKIFILAGYKGQQILKKFDKTISNGIKIDCIIENNELGTGGALSQLKNKTSNNLIIMNGDSFIKTELSDLFINSKQAKVNYMYLIKNKTYKSNKILSNLNINKKLYVNFNGNLMNAGIYYLNNKILNKIPKRKISLENSIIFDLIKKEKIKGKLNNSKFIDIGTYKNLYLGKKNFHKQFNQPAAFLDRDGVINYDHGYVHNMKNFDLRLNVIKGLKYLNRINYNIFIVTNQSGIARGMFTENEYFLFHKSIKEYFFKKGCFINDMQHCPFLKGAVIKKYDKSSRLRKPGNLMLLNLMDKWTVNKKESFMLGDHKKDQLAAKKSNLFFEFAKGDFNSQIRKIIKNLSNC
jgi:D,D-heptose 1,7-bisphosphate phosphatase